MASHQVGNGSSMASQTDKRCPSAPGPPCAFHGLRVLLAGPQPIAGGAPAGGIALLESRHRRLDCRKP
ncbi:hypothetical protein CTAM01_10182 [Colletotrichum tamarilloi]|uniref:Uncharacterized protein n=1 Tax=Colletotrichum tamarilloi TaxID=1209934 RepID=A0ABQ9R179_9PEZI|nr:uncharacterized protein CTAM01_10182 [Colletotrichum tamarilloi]KAI3527103.1 hypothetical protein CSPX01_17247 [Colletotrichum filicis]KAK1491859.1 hypothetical protein CTAM01_10182 [Colletotrichum tamarilloi]